MFYWLTAADLQHEALLHMFIVHSMREEQVNLSETSSTLSEKYCEETFNKDYLKPASNKYKKMNMFTESSSSLIRPAGEVSSVVV